MELLEKLLPNIDPRYCALFKLSFVNINIKPSWVVGSGSTRQ